MILLNIPLARRVIQGRCLSSLPLVKAVGEAGHLPGVGRTRYASIERVGGATVLTHSAAVVCRPRTKFRHRFCRARVAGGSCIPHSSRESRAPGFLSFAGVV